MYKILIIDDSRTVTETLKHFFRKSGHQVYTASNGIDGIKMIDFFVPDLVLTDIIMPGKDGVEVIMYVKNNFPFIMTVAMSSGGTIAADNHLSMIQLLGADFVLKKPVTEHDVNTILSRIGEFEGEYVEVMA